MSLQPPHLQSLLNDKNLMAKKALGQNFLLDFNITRRIASHAGDLNGRVVLEIGPGPGGLSWAILEKKPKKLIMLEKDHRFITHIQDFLSPHAILFDVINEDALTYPLDTIRKEFPHTPIKIVANLPFNVATPLLCGWLKDLDYVESMTLMFQKEVGKRISAKPHTGDYGRLSVLSQFICVCSAVYDVPAACFIPAPKVDSQVVHFTPRALSMHDMSLIPFIEKITHAAFGKRRKMIRQSLKELFTIEELSDLGISPTVRAENLTIDDYTCLANFLKKKA
jgi:16S rRNA (adenine1518-N6/adenine1519-N6)-dimethyltransferase